MEIIIAVSRIAKSLIVEIFHDKTQNLIIIPVWLALSRWRSRYRLSHLILIPSPDIHRRAYVDTSQVEIDVKRPKRQLWAEVCHRREHLNRSHHTEVGTDLHVHSRIELVVWRPHTRILTGGSPQVSG